MDMEDEYECNNEYLQNKCCVFLLPLHRQLLYWIKLESQINSRATTYVDIAVKSFFGVPGMGTARFGHGFASKENNIIKRGREVATDSQMRKNVRY